MPNELVDLVPEARRSWSLGISHGLRLGYHRTHKILQFSVFQLSHALSFPAAPGCATKPFPWASAGLRSPECHSKSNPLSKEVETYVKL